MDITYWILTEEQKWQSHKITFYPPEKSFEFDERMPWSYQFLYYENREVQRNWITGANSRYNINNMVDCLV